MSSSIPAPSQVAKIVLDTRDPIEARTRLASSYAGHSLSVAEEASFHATHDVAELGPISVFRLAYGAAATLSTEPLESWLLVTTPLQGRLGIHSEGRERSLLPGESVVLDSFKRYRLLMAPDTRLLTFRFERRFVEETLSEFGRDPGYGIRFGLGGPKSVQDAQTWNSVASLLMAEALPPGAPTEHPLLRLQVARTAAAALADTHPLERSPELSRKPHVDAGAMTRVCSLIEAQPAFPFKIEDLARSAGVSIRTLQVAFRDQLGTTPMAFVRDRRLKRAHEDLIAGQASTVADVAYHWGFSNLGRFSALYRTEFGQTPSRTLLEGRRECAQYRSP